MTARLLRLIVAIQILACILFAWWLMRSASWPPWLAILAGLALIPVLSACFVGLQSLVGARQRRNWRTELPDQRIPDPGWLAAWRAWLGETGASLRTFVLRVPWYGETPLPSGDDPERLPVVLVHGYFCNRAIWRTMSARLARRGHAIESVNLEPVFGGIDEYVPTVEAAVARLCARTGANQVGQSGHSMGGLAIPGWIRRHCTGRAASVVTLGTPHHGTWSAEFGIGRNVAQMRRDSPWLSTLAHSETPQIRRLFTVIITLHDNVVMPQAIQTLEGARTVLVAGVGHVALIGSAEVTRYAAAALDQATSKVCAAIEA
jgi:pimeloyl-ACP methyl ester carboxylesterase